MEHIPANIPVETLTVDVLSERYISHAQHLVFKEHFTKAFELYYKAFELNPEIAAEHEEEFHDVLMKMVTDLRQENNVEALFNKFNQALTIFPDSMNIMNNIGKYLYTYFYYKEAMDMFQRLLVLYPNFVEAEKNLNSVKNCLVERWHFRMLNDHIRNNAYWHAIKIAIKPNREKVLDVGTGTGLLAIYAEKAGAQQIVACDGSSVMTQLAEQVIRINNLKNIKVVTKLSTALKYGETQKRTLLITELFDAGLFGEHVLQMLEHAWHNLLTTTARVIPNIAEFFVYGVQCDYLNHKYQLSTEAKSFLDILSSNVINLSSIDTYDSEDVHLVKDIKYLTDPISVLSVNFNDQKNIEQTVRRNKPYKIEFKAKENGIVNLIVGWFNLYLSDTITITTNPLDQNRANAWQQAVFYNLVPKQMNVNDTFHCDFYVNDGKIKMSTAEDEQFTRVSAEIIRFLNDTEYLKMINSCAGIAAIHLGHVTGSSKLNVADLSPFPYFGFQMMKRGAAYLVCIAKNENDKQFIINVFKKNKIPLKNLTIITNVERHFDISESMMFHAIFTHSVDMCGDINFQMKDVAEYLKQQHLHPDGLILPNKIELIAQLISSHWLDINNRVYAENVSNYRIAGSINKYLVTQNFCIDFNTLKFVPISDPIQMGAYSSSPENESVQVQVINVGLANAILCWYKIELMADVKEISTNRPGSFMDGTLFLTLSKANLERGQMVRIAHHKSSNGDFKFALETN